MCCSLCPLLYCLRPICPSVHHKSVYGQLLYFEREFLKTLYACLLPQRESSHIETALDHDFWRNNYLFDLNISLKFLLCFRWTISRPNKEIWCRHMSHQWDIPTLVHGKVCNQLSETDNRKCKPPNQSSKTLCSNQI